MRTVTNCYNGNTSNCNQTAVSLPITEKEVFVTLPGGLESAAYTFYNSYGLVTEKDDYDWFKVTLPPATRKSLISYASLGNGIVDRPASVIVEDGSGNVKAKTTYCYDEGTPSGTTTCNATGSPTGTSGTPQHVSVSGSRGNVTTIAHLVQGSTTLGQKFTYFDTGNVDTATDVNGAATSHAYGDCGNSFPTTVTLPLTLSRSLTWNCTGGVEATATDENGQKTTFTYNDPHFWRINSVTDAAQNTGNMSYTGATVIEGSLLFNSSNATVDVRNNLDSLGRAHVTQTREGPTSSNYDSVETDYDSTGRPSRFTLPYTGTAGQTNSTAPGTTTTYDSLGRPTQVSDSGGGSVAYTYSQNDVLTTLSPAPSGENTKQRQMEYDGLGRLTSVCEVTAASGSGTCAQTSSATGFWTKYTYDAADRLLTVTQNAQAASSSQQSRSYAYDLMGRMTSETNPESGTTTYLYDTDSTCGTSNGDLVKRTDAVGNVTCFTRDALHRLTAVTYPSGSYAAATPSRHLVYDAATVNGQTMANGKNRLVEAYTGSNKATDLGFSYSALGQVTDVYESTPHSGGYYHVSAQYWANGALSQLSGISGLPTLNYTPDGKGRPSLVSASSGQNPVTFTEYNAASQVRQVDFGSTDQDVFDYDSNTNRVIDYKYLIGSQTVVGNLTWNANGTLQSLDITDPFNSANTQNCAYAHDDLTRIASANCGSVWSQTFSYDPFGNIDKSGSSSFQPTYSSPTNRMLSLPGFTPSYDANGNVLNDSFHSYSWDANGRPLAIDTIGLTYDALGRMVEQYRSGTYTEIVYSPTRQKFALMNGQTLQKAFVALPGGARAVYNSSGLLYYAHPDWLGTIRFGSTPSRAKYFDVAYGPFGEAYAQSGTTDLSFTGQNQDTTGGLYDFPAREYSIQGRWPSPDPAGLLALNPVDPQSFNRYAYVRNSPLEAVDPLGLVLCWTNLADGCSGGDPSGGYCPPQFGSCGDVPLSTGSGSGSFRCGVNPFCIANPPSPFSSPVAQIHCDASGQNCMTGSYVYGQQNNDGTWTVDWNAQRKGEIAAALNQIYQAFVLIATAMHLDPNAQVPVMVQFSSSVWSVWLVCSTSCEVDPNAANAIGWQDPVTFFHNGNPSWFAGPWYDSFGFDVGHLIGSDPASAHIDPFGPLNPLHYLIQLPSMFDPAGPVGSGTCWINGGCF